MHCQDGSILFAMGETGTMWNAGIEEKLAWVNQLTSAETANAMPNYVGGECFSCRYILPSDLALTCGFFSQPLGSTTTRKNTSSFTSKGTRLRTTAPRRGSHKGPWHPEHAWAEEPHKLSTVVESFTWLARPSRLSICIIPPSYLSASRGFLFGIGTTSSSYYCHIIINRQPRHTLTPPVQHSSRSSSLHRPSFHDMLTPHTIDTNTYTPTFLSFSVVATILFSSRARSSVFAFSRRTCRWLAMQVT